LKSATALRAGSSSGEETIELPNFIFNEIRNIVWSEDSIPISFLEKTMPTKKTGKDRITLGWKWNQVPTMPFLFGRSAN
jgi:hypothetical protein